MRQESAEILQTRRRRVNHHAKRERTSIRLWCGRGGQPGEINDDRFCRISVSRTIRKTPAFFFERNPLLHDIIYFLAGVSQ